MLCDLPPEIIVHVLAQLSPHDLLSCKITNKYLRNVVQDSVALQFGAALVDSRAEDNPCSTLPISEKLQQLRSAESAWSSVRPRFATAVPVTHAQSGVYDLTGGVYLLSNSTRTALHYLKLPSTEGDELQWKIMDFKKKIIDIGLCLFEHDLIVIVTTKHHASNPSANTQTTYDIEIEFLEFSTGNPHPRARESSILVMNSPWEKPAVGIEIVGDNLVLILSFSNAQKPEDRVFVYDWMNGTVKMSFLAPYRSYSGLIFLTEHLILVPNVRTTSLDIYRIPEKPTVVSPTPTLILRLPALAEERLMGGISCRAEPNPIGAASALSKRREGAKRQENITETVPERGFLARAQEAICIFEMRVLVLRLNLLQGGWNINFQPRDRFSFVVHRNSFVELVESFGKKEVEEHFEAGQTSPNSPSSASPSEPAPSSTAPETETTETTSNPTQHVPDAAIDSPSIPWSHWGPPVTRWFNSDTVSTRWITISAGQRCVRMEDTPPTGVPFTILDFNPVNVLKVKTDLRLRHERDFATWMNAPENAPARQGTSDSATIGSAAPVLEEDEESRRAGEGHPAVHPDPIPAVPLPEFQEGSSRQHDSDDDVVPKSATIWSSTTPATEQQEGGSHHGYQQQNGYLATSSSTPAAYLYFNNYNIPDDDEEEEDEDEDQNASIGSNEYFDADMYVDEDGSDGSTEYGMMDVGEDSHGETENDNDFHTELADGSGSRERIRVVTTFDQVEPADAFAEPVVGGLPYVACDSEELYTFDGVLLDEERVLGVRTNENDFIEQVEILYFG